MEVVRKGTNDKRMKRMCEYYSTSWAFGTAATPTLRQKRRAVAPCALLAPQPPNEPPSPLLAHTAALYRACAPTLLLYACCPRVLLVLPVLLVLIAWPPCRAYPRFDRLNAAIWRSRLRSRRSFFSAVATLSFSSLVPAPSSLFSGRSVRGFHARR